MVYFNHKTAAPELKRVYRKEQADDGGTQRGSKEQAGLRQSIW